MVLWIQNVSDPVPADDKAHDYIVGVGDEILAAFQHVRDRGAAACLRAAADAVDAMLERDRNEIPQPPLPARKVEADEPIGENYGQGSEPWNTPGAGGGEEDSRVTRLRSECDFYRREVARASPFRATIAWLYEFSRGLEPDNPDTEIEWAPAVSFDRPADGPGVRNIRALGLVSPGSAS